MNPLAFHSVPILLLEMLFTCLFFTIAGLFIITLSRALGQRNQPRRAVGATVAAKRTDGASGHYVAFRTDDGDALEFAVDAGAYGLFMEGDAGTLTFQGTRYLGFERRPNI